MNRHGLLITLGAALLAATGGMAMAQAFPAKRSG